MSCGSGAAVPIARTDSKGGFIVGRGRDSDVDARVANSRSAASGALAGCSFQARLPGYESSTLRVVDNEAIDIGTIVLSRPAGIEGTLHSATSAKAPKDAQKAFKKAMEALEKKKLDQVRPELEKAVKIYPEYAQGWFELGRVYQAAGDLPQALNAFNQSIKADPKYVRPYLQLTGLLYQQKDWKGTVDVSTTLIKLDPFTFPAAHVLNAISNFRLGNAAAAETSAREALKLDAGHAFPEAEYTLGLALGVRGEYKEAVEHLQAYLRLMPNSPGAEAVKQQIADFEKAQRTQPAGAKAPAK
jgi:tetratricopeptide (TPR) repeat protein